MGQLGAVRTGQNRRGQGSNVAAVSLKESQESSRPVTALFANIPSEKHANQALYLLIGPCQSLAGIFINNQTARTKE